MSRNLLCSAVFYEVKGSYSIFLPHTISSRTEISGTFKLLETLNIFQHNIQYIPLIQTKKGTSQVDSQKLPKEFQQQKQKAILQQYIVIQLYIVLYSNIYSLRTLTTLIRLEKNCDVTKDIQNIQEDWQLTFRLKKCPIGRS